jgi:glycosyltransferase involved in cell wall biosynthesis
MIIVHIVEPFAAGIAVFVKSLTEAMPDDMHIIVHGERKNEMSAKEVKKSFPRQNARFIKWRSAQRSIDPLKDLLALAELYKILRRLKRKNLVDAVHLHSSKSGLLGRAACKMAGITNVFYTPNGASFLSAQNRISRFFYQQLERVGNRLGGNVVCCSASELEEYVKLGINADYINNGITIGNHKRPTIDINARDKFRVVTSGRIEKQKDPLLFNEIATYFQDMEQFEFIWIGDGSYKKYFTAKNITVTGWIGTKEVHDFVAASHIYLSTSKYEGLSFAVLEALSLKKPVLLSNCTGNIDIVKRGINGDLFNKASEANVKILQYFNNREMLDVMGGFSAEICKTEFNVQENFKTYRELYSGALQKASAGKVKWSFGY